MENSLQMRHVLAYMLAGKATIGIHSLTSNSTYWYYIKKSTNYENTWYICINFGIVPKDDMFLGTFRDFEYKPTGTEDLFKLTDNDLTEEESRRVQYQKVFVFTLNRLLEKKEHPKLIFLHKGHCSYCGRPLTDAESLMTGIGPVCRKNLGL